MTMKPLKPITKLREGKPRQKYLTEEKYLTERYQISTDYNSKRLEGEDFEDYKTRRKSREWFIERISSWCLGKRRLTEVHKKIKHLNHTMIVLSEDNKYKNRNDDYIIPPRKFTMNFEVM